MFIAPKLLNFLSDMEKKAYIDLIEIKTAFHSNVNLSENTIAYINKRMSNFNILGFIEIPDIEKHSIVNFNRFFSVAFKTNDNRYFLPVGFKRERKNYFDNDKLEKGSYIIFYLGNDDYSYGQRFMSQDAAFEFASRGWKSGFDIDLLGLN